MLIKFHNNYEIEDLRKDVNHIQPLTMHKKHSNRALSPSLDQGD
jgi:hypothetical protein